MKKPRLTEDWTTVGSWKTGLLLVCLLGYPFFDYAVQLLTAHPFH